MSVIATALKHLIAAGVGGDDLVRAVEEIEGALTSDTRSPAAKRQAAYRERKAAADVTNDITDITERNTHNKRNGAGSPQESNESQPPSQSPLKPPFPISAALAAWNEMAKRAGLPQALSATGKRQASLRQRLAEHGEEGFRAAVAAVERSKFCRGENDRGWRADIGFLLRPDNFAKLIEGGFDSGHAVAGAKPPFDANWTVEEKAEYAEILAMPGSPRNPGGTPDENKVWFDRKERFFATVGKSKPRERATGPPGQPIGAVVGKVIEQAGIQGHVR